MKKILLLTLVTFSAQADVLLPIVKNYDMAEEQLLWDKIKTDKLPESLISEISVGDPNNSYSKIFPKSFLQNTKFLVCYNDCSKDSFSNVKNGMLKFNGFQEYNVIEQSNVYYWLERYFSFLEERFYFKSEHYLRAYTSREVKNESDKKMKNNAFFLPSDKSLSFLPANKNILMKLLSGKVNRSGFDPSVVIHEAGHFYFDQLFGHAVNAEIGGLNEGFADYLANIILENPKIGLVMLHGKALRDSERMITDEGQLKSYKAGKEVHDLGEGISYLLWETRKSTRSQQDFDRLVISAIKDISRNPYSSVHDFKEAMIARIKTILSGTELNSVLAKWESLIPGVATKLASKNFLYSNISSEKIGFEIAQISSDSMAETFAIDKETKINLEIGSSVKISEKQKATMVTHKGRDLWVAIDEDRKNIIGTYNKDGELLKDKSSLKELEYVLPNIVGTSDLIKDFSQKLQSFTSLLEGRGEFAMAYKVKKVEQKNSSKVINGRSFSSKTIHLSLGKKLVSRILGLPEISEIELYTAPRSMIDLQLPMINSEKVIGYSLKFKSGTGQQMILNKFSN